MAEKKMKIRRDDQVIITAGREKGKTGKVLRVNREQSSVVVEKLNMVKRHTKPTSQQSQGGIIEQESPLNVSNVMLLCGKCSKPSKVSKKKLEDGSNVRVCKQCGEVIDR